MNILLKNWNIVRAIRLVLGILMVAQAFSWQSVLIGMGGGILILSALLNAGCPGNSCSVSATKYRSSLNKKEADVRHEEAKTNQ